MGEDTEFRFTTAQIDDAIKASVEPDIFDQLTPNKRHSVCGRGAGNLSISTVVEPQTGRGRS